MLRCGLWRKSPSAESANGERGKVPCIHRQKPVADRSSDWLKAGLPACRPSFQPSRSISSGVRGKVAFFDGLRRRVRSRFARDSLLSLWRFQCLKNLKTFAACQPHTRKKTPWVKIIPCFPRYNFVEKNLHEPKRDALSRSVHSGRPLLAHAERGKNTSGLPLGSPRQVGGNAARTLPPTKRHAKINAWNTDTGRVQRAGRTFCALSCARHA